MKVCCLYEEVADGDGVEELSCSEAALDDCEAEGITQQEEPLLYTEGAEEDAAVGVVFHGLCHGERIGGGVGKLCGTSRGVVGVSSPATERKQSQTERKVARLQSENFAVDVFCELHCSLSTA